MASREPIAVKATHGKGVAVGAFLMPRERREIAAALNRALGARAAALREAVSAAVAQIPWLRERNAYWLNRYHTYGHRWAPEIFPLQTHNQMLFFYRGYPAYHHNAQRTFAGRYPSITQFEWVTEVPDETAQGDYLAECATAQTTADMAMLRLLAESAQPMQRQIHVHEDGRTTIRFHRNRQIGA